MKVMGIFRILMVLTLALGHFSPASAQTIKTVALKAGVAPPPGSVYARFRNPAIADTVADRVVVYSRNQGGKRCLFNLDPDGGLDATGDSVAVCEHDPSPDGATFARLNDPTINAAGEAAWSSHLSHGRHGVYRDGPALVALMGDPVPTLSPGLLNVLSQARITGNGDVVFSSTISNNAVNQGIFRCTGGDGNCHSGTGTLESLVLVNDSVPDRAGREFCSFNRIAASVFGIAFQATTKLDCANVAEPALSGVFRKPFGSPIVTVALQGEASNPHPELTGTLYGKLANGVAINDTGVVAFQAATTGLLNVNHLFVCDPLTCPAVTPADAAVTSGDSDGNGNAFTRLHGPAISSAGDIAFGAGLHGPSRSGVYVRRFIGDVIETIALRYDTVPGLPGGRFLRFFQPEMSPAGKVAFRARLKWPQSPPSNFGIFVFE